VVKLASYICAFMVMALVSPKHSCLQAQLVLRSSVSNGEYDSKTILGLFELERV